MSGSKLLKKKGLFMRRWGLGSCVSFFYQENALYSFNEGEFPTQLPLFSAWMEKLLSIHLLPLRVPNIRLDCKVLSRNFSLRHGSSPWITKSLIILLAKPAYSPWVAVTPDARCPPCSWRHRWCFPGRAVALCSPSPSSLSGRSVFLGTLAVFFSLQKQVALSNYA